MSFDHLFEHQPRWAEVLAGLAAALSGLFAFGFAGWLWKYHVLSGQDLRARPLVPILLVLGACAFVIARRLLAPSQQRPKYLFSAPTLLGIGILILLGGLLPTVLAGEGWDQAWEGIVLGGACVVLAVRRWGRGANDAA